MSTIDTLKRFIIDRLDTILDPYLLFLTQLYKIIQHLICHTVTACSDTQSYNILISECFIIEYFDRVERSIGIGKSLEIDQKFFTSPLLLHHFACRQYLCFKLLKLLVKNRIALTFQVEKSFVYIFGKIGAERIVEAKSTAAFGYRTIDIGTGKATQAQRKLTDFGMEFIFEILPIGIELFC